MPAPSLEVSCVLAFFILPFMISVFGFFLEFIVLSSRIWSTFPLVPGVGLQNGTFENSCQVLDRAASTGVIISIIVPGLGGLIPAAIVVHNTRAENCAKNKKAFLHAAMAPRSKLRMQWEKIVRKAKTELKGKWNETKFFDDWMNARCHQPHTVFLLFIILFSVVVGTVLLVIPVVCCVVAFIKVREPSEKSDNGREDEMADE
jgi:hypothetical protein